MGVARQVVCWGGGLSEFDHNQLLNRGVGLGDEGSASCEIWSCKVLGVWRFGIAYGCGAGQPKDIVTRGGDGDSGEDGGQRKQAGSAVSRKSMEGAMTRRAGVGGSWVSRAENRTKAWFYGVTVPARAALGKERIVGQPQHAARSTCRCNSQEPAKSQEPRHLGRGGVMGQWTVDSGTDGRRMGINKPTGPGFPITVPKALCLRCW